MAATRLMRACFSHVMCRNIFTKSVCYAPIQVQMPALSPTMEEGTIIKWLIAEGDKLEVGDAMCEVETDKAVVTMEANEDGTLAKILVPEGTKNVKISVPIAILAEDGEDISTIDFKSMMNVTKAETATNTLALQETQAVQPSKTSSLLSPAVRQALLHYQIDSKNVIGTGPKGIILKGDILKYVSVNNLKPQNFLSMESKPVVTVGASSTAKPITAVELTEDKIQDSKLQDSNSVDIELSNVRKVIAKRLTESKQTIPHAYSSTDCIIDKVLAMRKQFSQDGVKLSVNDFIIKAVALTLKQVPEVNCIWTEGKSKQVDSVDVSVAVATDGGLITPIVKDTSGKGLSTISDEVRDLASRARNGKLKPEEFQGGTFTISNLGMFGIREFTAVINPPQACILAVGGTRLSSTPGLIDLDNDDVTGVAAEIHSVMTVTMSSDARVVDDELASTFLAKLKQNVENPMRLVLN
ncbi:pyruvate dehydrogenase protein X component-like [Clavelina lepadiformis]|uniref:pyruvate dehydrogenase protein X component-like n=1 Tax=Clavelina lepadiformis TaxID=159417 RepID=UPI0040419ECA